MSNLQMICAAVGTLAFVVTVLGVWTFFFAMPRLEPDEDAELKRERALLGDSGTMAEQSWPPLGHDSWATKNERMT